jgi:hypothetical protein
MDSPETLRESDAAVVARYLHVRSRFHDGLLARVASHVQERYVVQPTHRVPATLVSLVRTGFLRPGEGELWPVVFLSPVDIFLALCVQISAERLADLGTMLEGPQRLRHRHWEDWWGWETTLGGVGPQFFSLSVAQQDDAMLAWYTGHLAWLARSGLLRRQTT